MHTRQFFSARMSVHLCAWCLRRPEEGIGFPGTGVTNGCKLLCGCWDSTLDALEKRPELLPAEPFL